MAQRKIAQLSQRRPARAPQTAQDGQNVPSGPPTADELQALVTGRLDSDENVSGRGGGGLEADLYQVILEAADWIDYPAMIVVDADDFEATGTPLLERYRSPNQDQWTPLWGELTDDEAQALRGRITEAVDRALARCRAIIVDEFVTAGRLFIEEHPDAQRWPAAA
jgi:hypothetical protein